MNSLKILIDMDDTIEHLLIAWVDYINKRYGTNVKYEDVTQWDLRVAFPTLTNQQLHSLLEEDDFWKTVKPMEGAAETLQWMMDQGHEVYIVTASAYRTIRPKMEHVLFKYFPFLTWDNVIITKHKQMIRGDILIDDAPHNHIGGRYLKVLMDAPHNQSFNAEQNGMCRIKNWNDAKSIIEGMEIDYKLSREIHELVYSYREDPDLYAKERLGIELNDIHRAVVRSRSRALGFVP